MSLIHKKYTRLLLASAAAATMLFAASPAQADVTNIFAKDYPPVDFTAVREETQRVMADGIVIDGADLSGLTLQQARTELSKIHSKNLLQNVTLNLGSVTVDVTMRELGADYVTGADDVCEKAITCGAKDGLLISRYKSQADFAADGGVFTSELKIDETAIDKFAEIELPKYDVSTVQDATIKRENGKFVITPEKNGLNVDPVGTAQALKEAIAANGVEKPFTVEAVCRMEEAKIKASDLECIQDVLGTFSTDVGGTDNRAHNVALGASNINGTLLMPGESGSTSALMKERLKENGYRLAPQYVDGDSVDAYGGGVCQVSSTLYNALLRAEIQIDERHPHSMKVTYVKASLDAAISWGIKDMKFTNNTDYPIYIEGESKNRVCTFTIYGKETRDTVNREVKYISTITRESDPADKIIYDMNQPVGYKVSKGSHHAEVESYMEKVVYINGQEVSRERMNTDHYYPGIRTITMGTGGVDPNAPTTAPTQAPTQPPTQPTQPPTEPPAEPPTEPPAEEPSSQEPLP